jgi:predicted lipoprotein
VSQTSAYSTARARVPRWIWLAGGAALLVLLLIIKPPFVVKPLARPGSTSAATQSKGAQVAEEVWESKVLPVIQEKAQDIVMVIQEIRADPAAAGQKYGRRESTNPYSYMVKGTGKVIEVHTESQAGTVVLEVPGLNEKIALQIGPVVRGTALRDATGAAPFDQFTNQLDYADVSKEMNRRAVKEAFAKIAPSTLADKSIAFFGAFTFDPRSKGLILVTPVKVEQ